MRAPLARPTAVACLFFVASGALYLGIGRALAPTRLFGRPDLALGTDVPRVIADLTRFEANHYRTKVHPLFVILLNPLGLALKQLLGAPRPAALLLNAAFAALGVALCHVLLRRLGVAGARAALWTALFALSSSQLFFGSVPETYAFSGASLLLLFVLFAQRRASGRAFVAAGVFAFGMTLGNLPIAVWLRACASDLRRGAWPLLPRLVRYVAAVVGLTAALAMLQALWYPRARLFFGPGALQEETQYAFLPGSPAALGRRLADLAANSLLYNLAAPSLSVSKAGHRYPVAAFTTAAPDSLRPAGALHAVLWGALLATAAAWAVRQRLHREPAAQALLGGLAFQYALHFFYGETLFLYSCHFTFAVIALAALAWEALLAAAPAWTGKAAAALGVLLALQSAANASFLYELYALYR